MNRRQFVKGASGLLVPAAVAAPVFSGLVGVNGRARKPSISSSSSSSGGGGSLLALPLVQNTDAIFTYVGSFSMPSTIKNDDGVGSGGMSVSEDGNSMYVSSFFGSLAKMSIPSSGTGSASLQVGWTSTPGSAGENQNKVAALEYGGNVYSTKYSHYTEASQTVWVQRGSTSLASFTSLQGTTGVNNRLFSQHLIKFDAETAALIGKPCGAMGCRQSIISNAACGYNLYGFDPADVDGSGNVAVVPVLSYTYDNPLEPGDSGFPGWSGYPKNANGGTDLFSSTNAYTATGLRIPGSRTFAVISAHGYGVADNGCRSGSSVHNDPNAVRIYFYDMQDFADVLDASIQPYAPRPYAWKDWNFGGVHWDACAGAVPNGPGWGAYCPVKNRLYMCENFFGENMHTWDVVGLS